jgi:hypothetical protein
MGNTITNLQTRNLNHDSHLGKFIRNWALNEYSIHPDTKNDPIRFKDSLQKRACCTNQDAVGISIAGVTDNSERIMPYLVNIPVFDFNDNPNVTISGINVTISGINVTISGINNTISGINNTNCLLDMPNSTTKVQFYDEKMSATNYNVNTQPSCKNFYLANDISNNVGFADYVLKNRSNNDSFPDSNSVTNSYDALYPRALGEQITGLLPNNSLNTDDTNLNPYMDINCIKSVYQVKKDIFTPKNDNYNNLIQQITNDGCYNNRKAYKESDYNRSNGCFSINTNSNIDASNITLIQDGICNNDLLQLLESLKPPQTSQPPQTSKPPQTSQPPHNEQTILSIINNYTYIIACICCCCCCIVIIIIIIIIIFK